MGGRRKPCQIRGLNKFKGIVVDIELIIFIVMFLLLIVGLNITECWWQYKTLIKDGKIYRQVPSWQGTNKAHKWYIIWSAILWLDLVGYLIFAILADSVSFLLIGFLVTVPPFLILYATCYLLLSKKIFQKAKEKNKGSNDLK